MKTVRERERGKGAQKGDRSLTILSNHQSDETLHEWQFLNLPPPVEEKTATRNPSSRGKCKEKQEAVRETSPFLWLSLNEFLRFQVGRVPVGPGWKRDKRGAEVGGLSIVFVPFLSVLALWLIFAASC